MKQFTTITCCLFILALFSAEEIFAGTFTATTSGNWNSGTTWGNPGNDTAGVGYPDVGDTANIHVTNSTAVNVTIPSGFAASAALLVFNDGLLQNNAVLSFTDATSSLNVSGDVIMKAPAAVTTAKNSGVVLNGGTLTIDGALTLNSQKNSLSYISKLVFTGGGNVTVGGEIGRAHV